MRDRGTPFELTESMLERAFQRITPNLPVVCVRYEMVKSVVTTRGTKPMRTPMPAVSVLLVMPPPSPRGERISSIKFRDLDRQLEYEMPEYNPKAQLQLRAEWHPRLDAPNSPSPVEGQETGSHIYYVTLAPESYDHALMQDKSTTNMWS